jgi:hypothetical protein
MLCRRVNAGWRMRTHWPQIRLSPSPSSTVISPVFCPRARLAYGPSPASTDVADVCLSAEAWRANSCWYRSSLLTESSWVFSRQCPSHCAILQGPAIMHFEHLWPRRLGSVTRSTQDLPRNASRAVVGSTAELVVVGVGSAMLFEGDVMLRMVSSARCAARPKRL